MHKGKSGGTGAADGRGGGNGDALLYPGDAGFAMRLLAGLKAEKGESWARCEFHDYTQGLVDLLLDKEDGLCGELSCAEPLEKVQLTKRKSTHTHIHNGHETKSIRGARYRCGGSHTFRGGG